MATRDLATNTQRALKQADGIVAFTSQELVKSYTKALKDIRKELDVLYKKFLTMKEPTKAQLTQFMRKQKPNNHNQRNSIKIFCFDFH